MLPVFAIVTAALGLALIVFLIYREEASESGSTEKAMLFGSTLLVLAVGVWQAIAHLPGAGSGGH